MSFLDLLNSHFVQHPLEGVVVKHMQGSETRLFNEQCYV